MTEKNRPTRKFKLMGIEVAEWSRLTAEGKTFKTYSFQKSYKDQNGDWQHSTSFTMLDLPVLASLILLIVGKGASIFEPDAPEEKKQTKETLIEGNTVPEENDVPF